MNGSIVNVFVLIITLPVVAYCLPLPEEYYDDAGSINSAALQRLNDGTSVDSLLWRLPHLENLNTDASPGYLRRLASDFDYPLASLDLGLDPPPVALNLFPNPDDYYVNDATAASSSSLSSLDDNVEIPKLRAAKFLMPKLPSVDDEIERKFGMTGMDDTESKPTMIRFRRNVGSNNLEGNIAYFEPLRDNNNDDYDDQPLLSSHGYEHDEEEADVSTEDQPKKFFLGQPSGVEIHQDDSPSNLPNLYGQNEVMDEDYGVGNGRIVERSVEYPEEVALYQNPLEVFDKKDKEELGILNQGTGNKEHRIQTRNLQSVTPNSLYEAYSFFKDPSTRIVKGNRVYLRLNTNFTTKDWVLLDRIADYLDRQIAKPNNLTLINYQVNFNELSFDVYHKDDKATFEQIAYAFDTYQPVNFSSAGLVASEVYNLMKKSPALVMDSGRQVPEVIDAGVGSGPDSVSFKGSAMRDDDKFLYPTLLICGFVIGTLLVIVAVFMFHSRSRSRQRFQLLSGDLGLKPSKDYQELCRQRMSSKSEDSVSKDSSYSPGIIGTLAHRLGSQSEHSPPPYSSTHSSTSSWSEEPVQTNMDITTGHTILSYMEKHLEDRGLLIKGWKSVESYVPEETTTVVATLAENASKNRYRDVLPYDQSRVKLMTNESVNTSDYINASFIYDHDPRQPVYIATQGPLPNTVDDFWQMIWEQGCVVIVNLTRTVENNESKCCRYWPESGGETYRFFDVNLVSEHIWCTDYLVRSFYIKHRISSETRTVTQLHFLAWPDGQLPPSAKSILDFRRKVNKSFRGKSSPVVIHCSDGASRTGTYCLLDMALNRINKGIKEINIAASLEHLRDQRMKLVKSLDQFEFALICIAEEVQAVLKAMPQ